MSRADIERLRNKHNMAKPGMVENEEVFADDPVDITSKKVVNMSTPKKWRGFLTAMDVNKSRFIQVSYDNEALIREIARNNNYDVKGWVGDAFLMIHKGSEDQFSPRLGDVLRIMNDAEEGDLEKITWEEFQEGWDLFWSNFDAKKRVEDLERKVKALEDIVKG